jgi:hypothetical protein
MWQVAALSKGTPYALAGLPGEETLVLLMVHYLAAREWIRKNSQAQQESSQYPSWLLSPTAQDNQQGEERS